MSAEHIFTPCMVSGCPGDASYFIDTSEGFTESLLPSVDAPNTFYLCADHMTEIQDEDGGSYKHLRIDTGEIVTVETGKYSCSEECSVCALT